MLADDNKSLKKNLPSMQGVNITVNIGPDKDSLCT